MSSARKPLLVYDGDCSFCRAWLARWRRTIGDTVEFAPYQEIAARFPEIPRARFAEAVHLREPDGRWSRGAEAVFRSLAHGGARLPLAMYRHLPGFARISEAVYRLVAGHRPLFERVTRAIWGDHLVPPGETLTIWIFLRAMGVITLIAFVSMWVQIDGLVGRQGILPAGEFLAAVRQHYGPVRFWLLPTFSWLAPSDAFLHAQCALGTALALLLAIGIAPAGCIAGCFALYLSLATVCRDFFWFQWDGLLLETLFLALFLAPLRWWSRPASDPPPRRAALWMTRWLLFRLMIASAAVKLTSGDPSWRHLTALQFHYETQCLPPWTAWYFHHFSPGFQRFSGVVMFVIEGLVPFLIVLPRRIRFAAVGALIGLQLLIVITGNYGFFNLLAIALCIPLLDDGVWPRARRTARGDDATTTVRAATSRGSWPGWIVRPVFFVTIVTSLVPTMRALHAPFGLGPVASFDRAIAPLRLINSYGLFAVMTTVRNEIVLEGSDDGTTWRAYEFRWKPGDPKRRPKFMAPHMPRLDWQMWFAALDDVRNEPWFLSFCETLLRGSPAVARLMAANPFPEHPPRYLRATLFEYHFTDTATRRATGAWWRREPKRAYAPLMTLEDGRLVFLTNVP